jgi:hypothetical protein
MFAASPERAGLRWAAPCALVAMGFACVEPSPGREPARAAAAIAASASAEPTTARGAASTEAPAAPSSRRTEAAPAASDEPSATEQKVVSLTIAADQPPCVFAIEAGLLSESAIEVAIGGVTRIATLDGGACSAGLLYDHEAERVGAPEDTVDPMMGGRLRKPGIDDGDDAWDGDGTSRLADLDFDGWADLCIVEVFGSYSYSQRCWRFDPSARVFRRAPELEPLTFATADRANRRIESARRVTGAIYEWQRHVWERGVLVLDADEITYLGESPSGKPLPPPATEWVRRRERREGKLVVVREGPHAPKRD